MYYSEEMNPGFDITGNSYKRIDLSDAKVTPTLDTLSHEVSIKTSIIVYSENIVLIRIRYAAGVHKHERNV